MKLLDVGGKEGLLRFFPGFQPVVLDTEKSNEPRFVQGNALNLPFANESFDIAVSCDVLEHISVLDRERFMLEMLRVSRWGIILCAPFNNTGVSSAEQEMNAYHKHLSKHDHRWLKEHIDNRLPEEKAVEKILNTRTYKYAKFHHFSLDAWRIIVKMHLLQSAFNDDKDITRATLAIYKSYYMDLCQLDYSEEGYRTFYIVKKKGSIAVGLPDTASSTVSRKKFKYDSQHEIFNLVEQKIIQQRDLFQTVVAMSKQNQAYSTKNTDLTDRLNELTSSKRWRYASSVADAKQLFKGSGVKKK
jgi:predicted SAM-dependent methyltransferase